MRYGVMSDKPRVTSLDVARAAGVSQQTVSLTMRNHPRISAETKARVLAASGALVESMVEDDVLAQLLERTANLVLVGRDTPLPVSWDRADEEGGAYKLGRHLLAQGRKRPALLAVDEAHDSEIARERVRGFRRALTEAGLDLRQEQVAFGDWSFESGYTLGQQLLTQPEPPDAVFALAEAIAVGLVEAARHLGVRVPADLSVVTTEDNDCVKHVVPTLTSSHVPMFEVGVRATELLLARLTDRDLPTQHLVIPTTLHVRESSLTLDRGEVAGAN